MAKQTDEVLRTYREYMDGRRDFDLGLDLRTDYPFVGTGGQLLKKAYLLGMYDRFMETTAPEAPLDDGSI